MTMREQESKRSSKIYLLLTAAVMFIAAGIFMYEYASKEYQIKKAADNNLILQSEIVDDNYINNNNTANSELNTDTEELKNITKNEYISPIDFQKLKSKNSDSVAWLVIPDTDLSFPVMFHEGDNNYYLNRNFDNEWSVYGAAYIEDYNNADMSDTAIVVYGHNIKGGKWFGEFQSIYTDKDQFERSRDIKMYLPDEERTYRVFAAVEHNNEHLLEQYDFDSPGDYNRFINQAVSARTVNGITDKNEIPEAGTPLLILSSCLKGDSTHRFLVLAYQCQ